jgi:hypothetical protein
VTNVTSAMREEFCPLFLSHLPPNYRVTTGELIDVSNNETGQLDVTIVNEFAPPMTIANTTSVIDGGRRQRLWKIWIAGDGARNDVWDSQ